MKNLIPALSAAILLLSACSQQTRTTGSAEASMPISATMRMAAQDTVHVGEKLVLNFTVHNTADTVQQFCKWQTPFEPLMSKYLDVTASTGEEVNYQGAMAKRIMPPPADSYIKVKPGDSLSIEVDVLKAYAVKSPARYTIRYNSQGISGLSVKDSIEFVYAP